MIVYYVRRGLQAIHAIKTREVDTIVGATLFIDIFFSTWAAIDSHVTSYETSFFAMSFWFNFVVFVILMQIMGSGNSANKQYERDRSHFQLEQFRYQKEICLDEASKDHHKEYELMNNALGYLIELTRASDQPITLLGIKLTWDKVLAVGAVLVAPFAGNLPQPHVLLPHAYSTRIANTNSYLPTRVRVSHTCTRLTPIPTRPAHYSAGVLKAVKQHCSSVDT